MTRKPTGIAIRAAVQAVAFGAAALMLLVTLSPTRAVDARFADVKIAEVQLPLTALPVQAEDFNSAAVDAKPALTPEVLAAYVARQQARKGFDIFGEAPQPQLTSAVLSAYAATRYQNAALSAINNAAEPLALRPSFSPDMAIPDTGVVPSVSDDALAEYARKRFQPTEKKVKVARQERDCLTTAIYHEARGESDDGQWAVANVIINRAMSKQFPSTMCGVVYQNANAGKYQCQFSFACDGHSDVARERRAWAKANRIAANAFAEFQRGQRPGVLPGSALYYHTRAVSPKWSNTYRQVAQIGAHVFYSPL